MTITLSHYVEFFKALIRNLWLSVSSSNFYRDVFLLYRGYGIKYLFTLSVISSIYCTIIFLNYSNNIIKYLEEGILSQGTYNIDHLMKQLPSFIYDGSIIETDVDMPVFIKNMQQNTIIAIDTSNKLLPGEKVKIPIILTSDKININLADTDGKLKNSVSLKYSQLFSSDHTVITNEVIKLSLLPIFKKYTKLLIYIFFPIITAFILFNTLLERSIMILLVFILSKINRNPAPFSSCVRVVLFSSGMYTFLQFLSLISMPWVGYILWAVQAWATLLMINGLIKAKKNDIILFR